MTPVELIAEVGSVHDGSFGNAKRLIDAAAECGAHTVKFQTHIAAAETRRDAPAPSYFADEARFDYFERTGFTPPQWAALVAHAERAGVELLSSPFSVEAVEILADVGLRRWKVPSGEVTNTPLLERIAATGQPVLLSSGMSSWAELDDAVAVLRGAGPLNLMQCSSIYPCPPERVGLNVIAEMRDRYGVPVGYSDHTRGLAAAIAAVAHGAVVVEKHFTFSTLMYGSDAKNAMEPHEFRVLAAAIAEVAVMLDHPVDKDDLAPYGEMRAVFQKSIVTAREIAAGSVISAADLACKKPGTGIAPRDRSALVGKRARRDLPSDHQLAWDDVE